MGLTTWRGGKFLDRIIMSSNDLPLPPLSNPPHNVRPSTYKFWDNSVMAQALNAVITEGMSVRAAASHFGVPKSTLIWGTGLVVGCKVEQSVAQNLSYS